MKTLLLLCLLILPWATSAQSLFAGLPVDSASGKITYQGVVQVAGATKAELHSRGREWAATEFRSAKNVVQMDDKEAGTLIVRGFIFRNGYVATLRVWRTIKLYSKDGRYRYEITDFLFEGPAVRYASKGIAEKEIEIEGKHANPANPKGHYKYLLESISQSTDPEVASLKQAMAASSKKDF